MDHPAVNPLTRNGAQFTGVEVQKQYHEAKSSIANDMIRKAGRTTAGGSLIRTGAKDRGLTP